MTKTISLLLIYCCFVNFLLAQCDLPLPPGPDCSTAPLFCGGELNGYCSVLPVLPNPTAPNPLCAGGFVPNNTQWLAFAAGSTNLTLSITWSNCTQGGKKPKMQAGIVADCSDLDGSAVVCVAPCPGSNPIMLLTNALTVGKDYYLWIDGCAGASCDYTIDIIDGSTSSSNLGPTGPVTGPVSGCLNSSVIFSIDPVMNAGSYSWTVSPAAPFTVIGDGTSVEVSTWPDTGNYEICVVAENACQATPNPPECFTFSALSQETDTTDLGTAFYCIGTPGYYNPQTDEYLASGDYCFLFTNVDGCDSLVKLVVETWPEIIGTIDTLIGASCADAADGSVSIGIQGGTPPYSYLWDANAGNQTTPVAIDLAAGDYTVTITDSNGCERELSVTIPASDPYTFELLSTMDVLCFGDSTGSIELLISPDSSQLQIDREPPFVDDAIPAGTYLITATDTNGCAKSIQFTISQPDSLTVTTQSTPATGGQANGSASATVSGGVPPYIYLWNSNPPQTTPTATGLAAGDYELLVTDANGCEQTVIVRVDENTGWQELGPDGFAGQIFPNPNDGRFQIQIDHRLLSRLHLEIYRSDGEKVFQQTFTVPLNDKIKVHFPSRISGVYWLKISDGTGKPMALQKMVIIP